jgi:hypothetical protein
MILKLGDAVHVVAQPVAKAIDMVFRTSLQTCAACAERRERLNNLFVFGAKILVAPTSLSSDRGANEQSKPTSL